MPSTPSYHSHHAPLGAFASFTLGLTGGGGGFGQSLKGPACQKVYVGCRDTGPDAAWRLLPFNAPAAAPADAAHAYTGERTDPPTPRPSPFKLISAEDVVRSLGLASDSWQHEAFSFRLLTPFEHTADPATNDRATARRVLAPVVSAEIAFDNTAGTTDVELLFGLGGTERAWRPLGDTDAALSGFASGPAYGFATPSDSGARMVQGFTLFAPTPYDHRGLHQLGAECGLVFRVPAGERRAFPLALGFYQAGPVCTGLVAEFLYTRYFDDLEDVLRHGLATHAARSAVAAARDAELAASTLDEDRRFLIAQSVHSYFGSTQLMVHEGRPLWVVNEGEYRMMNTFDLTVDHLFFELAWHPWAVRDALDLFADRYSYTDTLHRPDGRTAPGGISFTHDMGVMCHFTPPGRSSYECTDLAGCFSHMTMEQLVNWVLCAVTYAEQTGDTAWLPRRQPTLDACAASLRQRDDPDPTQRDGVLKWDSDRCGPRGREITTYDSLDVSLGQAANNLYLAVKTLAAWHLLARAYRRLNRADAAAAAHAHAELLTATLNTKWEPDTSCFPAVFEAGNRARLIPAVEGLVFLDYLDDPALRQPSPALTMLLARLESHLTAIFAPGVCLDPATGGWKLSSTSTNTWFSKIALCRHVMARLFPRVLTPPVVAADRVHADWQRQPGCGKDALCDQIDSDTGVARGSKYYPRGVTAWLWLREQPPGRSQR
jgi:xylan 1,4-beta-xylosidase